MSKEHLMPPWKPGQSGNPSGKTKGRLSLTVRLRRALKQACKEGKGQQADALARAVIDAALAGDVSAMKLAFDRIDGLQARPVAPQAQAPDAVKAMRAALDAIESGSSEELSRKHPISGESADEPR